MTSSPTLIRDDVEVVEKTTPYDGYFKLDIYRLKHKLFEGGWSGEMEREIFERGHAVGSKGNGELAPQHRQRK